MAIFAIFIINTKTRASALVLVIGYLVYWFVALELSGLHRYGFIALINVVSGLYLTYKKKDYPIAILFYIAVIIGFFGGVLYVNYYPKYYYDNMCITIMTLQALALIYRVILNGLGNNKLHSVYGYIYNDGNKRGSQVLKDKGEEKANR